MTIEELRGRKRELLARKKYEQDLMDAGQGDALALFMVREELLEVSAQLRALTPRHRVSQRRASGDFAGDRQQYLDWERREHSLDEEIDAGREALRGAAARGVDRLTTRQREILTLYVDGGMRPIAIARRLGVAPSTVCRALHRAKKRLREETTRAMAAAQLPEGTVDLSDPAAAKAVLLAMSPVQTVYFYLYYSEWLTLREIGALTGVNASAILRTIRRGLRNVDRLLGGQGSVLTNPEALDMLAYQAYCELLDRPELLPEGAPRPAAYRPKPGGRKRRREPAAEYRPAVRVLGRSERRGMPGRLLSALLARREERPLLAWLVAVFRRLKTCMHSH